MTTNGFDVSGPAKLVLRCECGANITATRKSRLVELARIHFGEFHPDLGAGVPADLILAMAEEKEAAAL
jgi:TPR repeat protein